MVRIVDYKERTSEEGKEFFVLEIQGEMEMVKSQQTGKYYATARKTSIPSTFNEETCESLLGTELPGKIAKVDCDPYEYTIQDTGDVIELAHTYEYVEEKKVEIDELEPRKPFEHKEHDEFELV